MKIGIYLKKVILIPKSQWYLHRENRFYSLKPIPTEAKYDLYLNHIVFLTYSLYQR